MQKRNSKFYFSILGGLFLFYFPANLEARSTGPTLETTVECNGCTEAKVHLNGTVDVKFKEGPSSSVKVTYSVNPGPTSSKEESLTSPVPLEESFNVNDSGDAREIDNPIITENEENNGQKFIKKNSKVGLRKKFPKSGNEGDNSQKINTGNDADQTKPTDDAHIPKTVPKGEAMPTFWDKFKELNTALVAIISALIPILLLYLRRRWNMKE